MDLGELVELLKEGRCLACNEKASPERKAAPLMGRKAIMHYDCAERLGID